MNSDFKADYYRNTGEQWRARDCFKLLFYPNLRYLYYLRKAQNIKNRLIRAPFELLRKHLSRRLGTNILPQTKIAPGLRLIHPTGITVSIESKLGKNINLYKGCTIGWAEGKHRGAPTLGNNVQVGINSTVVGGITIGDDVLIAPNTFINTDVDSHNIVIGNPAKVISKQNATKDYVDFLV